MLRVMDTYRKSVDYYNSYGLKSASGSRKNRSANKKKNGESGTFWDLNWNDLNNHRLIIWEFYVLLHNLSSYKYANLKAFKTNYI